MTKTLLLLLLLLVSTACLGQQAPRAEILVLGTYHMANPGHDLHNMTADDVLSPQRQREVAQLIEVLKRFHPTKVAIEATVGSKRVAQEYADYLAGKYQLTRNEDDQIGYRLAKELGQRVVYAVDEDGDFPFPRVMNYAKATGRAQKLSALEAATEARIRAEGEFLKSHTVLEMLGLMNSDASVAQDMAWYFDVVSLGDPGDYAGPDLLAAWYQRNIRIYHNIVALIDSPSDRILVTYGAGHLGWLRQDAANDPNVKLRTLAGLVHSP